MALERILIAGRQDQAKFTPFSRLLDTCEFLGVLKILVDRRLTDHIDRI
jgi:hypothetical protein